MSDWEKTGLFTAFLQMKSGNEKAPLGQYTKSNENHCRLEQVQKLPRYMGILAPDTVLLDADSEPHSDNLLKLIQDENLSCLLTKRNGGRGNHALFLDSEGLIKHGGTGLMLACGIVVDAKLGRKNGLECLKWDGVEREIIHDVAPYQQIPKYLTPIPARVDFTSLDEGDGRNQALFNYILTLQAAGFEIEEARTCIRLINRYVLKKPLPDSELDVILRDAAFKKPVFFKGSTFLFDKFAIYLKNTHHIKKINGQLYFYKDGGYIHDNDGIEKLMIDEISSLTDAKRKEVLKYLSIVCEPVNESGVNLIAFRNGILDIDTDTISPCSPDVVITNRINWDYNPNAYDELMDKTLNKMCCGDMEIRMLLEEMVGACFYRSDTVGSGKAFVLTGEKANGKSTFLEVLKTLLGSDNVSNLDLKEIDERFNTAMLFGKLANIGDDISDNYKAETSVFKKIVTGNAIKAEYKGLKPFDFKPYVKLIFSANVLPRIKDSTGAISRRLQIIPFNAIFSETDEDYDPQIIWKLQKQPAIEYLIRLGVEGLKRVLKNQRFTESEKVNEAKDDYNRENNPVLTFVDEIGVDNIDNEPTADVLRRFNVFCADNGFRQISITKLTRELKKAGFETETKTPPKRKSFKIYVYKGEKLTL
ncbi:MAG: DNA primase [Firmicutes bacterium]|nr:DNA primase [Bacillota bacterium]